MPRVIVVTPHLRGENQGRDKIYNEWDKVTRAINPTKPKWQKCNVEGGFIRSKLTKTDRLQAEEGLLWDLSTAIDGSQSERALPQHPRGHKQASRSTKRPGNRM